MEKLRKPFQGVYNIIRFNWHFYLLSAVVIGILLFFDTWYSLIAAVLTAIAMVNALLVSFYVYDLSGLYRLNWAGPALQASRPLLLNIHAGFDETSELLQHKFPGAGLLVFDFYNPLQHTEVSIKRARRAYPPYPGTQAITSSRIPLMDETADRIFITLSAHEIRDRSERADFFKEVGRVLKKDGQVYVTEHLRDFPNFLAFNIGFFHFIPVSAWKESFRLSGLKISEVRRLNPFITRFILEKYGNSN